MSSDNFNNTENNSHNEEELTSILKRLSEILDKSVSLDEAVAMVKEQKVPADTAAKKTDTTPSSVDGQLSFDLETITDNSEEAIAEETVAEETVAEEAVAEETVAEETVAEEAVAEEAVAEEAVAEETVAEETVAEEAVAEEAIAEETVAEETVAEETVAEETVAEETVAEEAVAEETVAEEAVAEETVAEEAVAEETVTEETVSEEDAEADDLIKKIMSAIQTAPEEEKEDAQTESTEDAPLVESSEAAETDVVTENSDEITEEPQIETEQIIENEPVTEQTAICENTAEEDSVTLENAPISADIPQEEMQEETKTEEEPQENTVDSKEEAEEIATPKIFDELLACFDGHKLPEDFRFSDYNTEDSSVTEEQTEITEENSVSDEALSDTSDTTEATNSVTETEETTEDETENTADEPSFTPIDHEISQDDDELFSKIFSEEKTERKNRENDKKKWQRQNDVVSPLLTNLFDWIEVIVLSAAFALLLFTFVFRLAVVEGDSMMNTLYDNELLVISDLMYTPEQGDIIVFTSSGHAEPLVKRVIATEGQTVDIDFETWTVTVDGVPLDEKYVNRVAGFMHHKDVMFPLTVSEGHIFVMGDNRNNSKDSRDSSIGLVDTRNILGEVKVRLFPFNRFGKVD